ncbi:MAG: hypothetical protein AAFV53_29645 [Myxococcota bacterium]
MAIDLTQPGPRPAFGGDTAVGTTCTQIRVPAWSRVTLFADGAVYVFNGVDDGAAVPGPTARKALSADQAAQGYPLQVGGRVAGATYATLCVAAQADTVAVEVVVEHSDVRS